jgi:hypothetical protein
VFLAKTPAEISWPAIENEIRELYKAKREMIRGIF